MQQSRIDAAEENIDSFKQLISDMAEEIHDLAGHECEFSYDDIALARAKERERCLTLVREFAWQASGEIDPKVARLIEEMEG